MWSLVLNIIATIAFSTRRAPTAIERVQAEVFVPTGLAPMAPSFRLWRSSVTVEELTGTVARYLGEERTRASFESFAGTKRISLRRTPKPTSSSCATPSISSPPRSGRRRRASCCRCCCASAPSRQRPR